MGNRGPARARGRNVQRISIFRPAIGSGKPAVLPLEARCDRDASASSVILRLTIVHTAPSHFSIYLLSIQTGPERSPDSSDPVYPCLKLPSCPSWIVPVRGSVGKCPLKEGGQLGPVPDAALSQQFVDMVLHRPYADRKRRRDLPVPEPQRHRASALQLP